MTTEAERKEAQGYAQSEVSLQDGGQFSGDEMLYFAERDYLAALSGPTVTALKAEIEALRAERTELATLVENVAEQRTREEYEAEGEGDLDADDFVDAYDHIITGARTLLARLKGKV